MTTFTPAEFMRFLEERQRAIPVAQEAELHVVGERLKSEAQQVLGEYQMEDTGPFPQWRELADWTQSERMEKGYEPNDPGLASGEMRESVKSRVEGASTVIGSDDPHALWFEHGTVRSDAATAFYQPPRSFLGLTMWRHGKEEAERMAKAVFKAATGTGG